MALAHVGTNSNTASTGSSVSVTLPGGVQQDDAAYIAVASSRTVNQDILEDSGIYTKLADLFRIDSQATQLGVFRKVQGATPDSAVTITIPGNSTFAIAATVLRGVDATTPEDAAPATATDGNSATADPPAITTATDGAWVIAIGGSSESAVVINPPTNYGHLVTATETNITVAMASREIASAGVEDPAPYADIVGQATDCWCAATVAVQPAAGGASGDALIAAGAAVDAAGTKAARGSGDIGTGAAVAAAGIKVAAADVAIPAGVAVTASGVKTAIGSAGVELAAALDGAGSKTAIGTAEIAVGVAVTASGGSGVGGDVVIAAGAAVAASGAKGAIGDAAIGAGDAVSAAGAKNAIGQASAAVGAEIIALGAKRAGGSVVIASAAAIIASWGTQRFGDVAIASAAVVVAAGGQVGAGDVGRISLTGRVDGPAALEGRHEPTIQLTGRK